MRIALLTTNLAIGGAENQVAQLAMRLQLRGHETTVVTMIPPTAWREELESAGVKVRAAHAVGLLLVLAGLRPEVLHCHMFHANIAGRLLRTVLPFPAVLSTVHSVRETPRGRDRYWPRAAAYALTKWFGDRTVRVFEAPVNGVDTRVFRLPSEPLQNERFTWLAAGRLMWKKDYPTLLEAMRMLPEARLQIAGRGPDEEALRKAAPPNVTFLGQRSDLPELMRASNGFVLSSVIEGLPVTILEAQASGLPVVATSVGGIGLTKPERLVKAGDATALAAAMREVMQSPIDAEAIRERTVLEFGWEVVADRWEQHYREALAWT